MLGPSCVTHMIAGRVVEPGRQQLVLVKVSVTMRSCLLSVVKLTEPLRISLKEEKKREWCACGFSCCSSSSSSSSSSSVVRKNGKKDVAIECWQCEQGSVVEIVSISDNDTFIESVSEDDLYETVVGIGVIEWLSRWDQCSEMEEFRSKDLLVIITESGCVYVTGFDSRHCW